PYWEPDGSEIWEKYFGDKKAINLGHGGDRTQNVLWRLENYDFSAIHPKAAVLLIGVNNTWERNYDPKNVALGQRRVVQKLRELFPDMKIFVLPIFPCASREDQQACNDAINALTPLYMRDLENVDVLDIGKVFLNKDGVLTKDVFPDLLHPNATGYEYWGAALYLPLQKVFEKR
ncbi:MAG: GDSL-type esterase/lipase family protein, partial [Thermoguttaceae bacterium]